MALVIHLPASKCKHIIKEQVQLIVKLWLIYRQEQRTAPHTSASDLCEQKWKKNFISTQFSSQSVTVKNRWKPAVQNWPFPWYFPLPTLFVQNYRVKKEASGMFFNLESCLYLFITEHIFFLTLKTKDILFYKKKSFAKFLMWIWYSQAAITIMAFLKDY